MRTLRRWKKGASKSHQWDNGGLARKFARLVTLMAIGNRPRGKPDLTQRFGLQHFQATPGAHGGQNIWQKMATRLKRGGGSSSQSSEELRQQCSSERLRARTPQQSRRDEIGGAKDAQRGARRGRRGENAVARRCDGAAAPPPRWRCHFLVAQAGKGGRGRIGQLDGPSRRPVSSGRCCQEGNIGSTY